MKIEQSSPFWEPLQEREQEALAQELECLFQTKGWTRKTEVDPLKKKALHLSEPTFLDVLLRLFVMKGDPERVLKALHLGAEESLTQKGYDLYLLAEAYGHEKIQALLRSHGITPRSLSPKKKLP